MMAHVPTSEFYEWMILEKIEPFGEYGDYLRAGIIASTIANVNRGKDTKAFKPQDFMPKFEAEKQQGPQDFLAALMALKKGQDSILRAQAKRERKNADSRRIGQVRGKVKRHRADGPEKGAR